MPIPKARSIWFVCATLTALNSADTLPIKATTMTPIKRSVQPRVYFTTSTESATKSERRATSRLEMARSAIAELVLIAAPLGSGRSGAAAAASGVRALARCAM